MILAGASVFGVAAPFAGVEEELDAEVFLFGIRGGLSLDDDLISFAIRELGGGNQFAVFDLEDQFGLAAGGFSGGGDDFGAGGLGFQCGVIDGDADAAVIFDEELGLLDAEVEQKPFAGTGFDFGVGKGCEMKIVVCQCLSSPFSIALMKFAPSSGDIRRLISL